MGSLGETTLSRSSKHLISWIRFQPGLFNRLAGTQPGIDPYRWPGRSRTAVPQYMQRNQPNTRR
jgi:hypothetical protein